jgi:hypothetical protein
MVRRWLIFLLVSLALGMAIGSSFVPIMAVQSFSTLKPLSRIAPLPPPGWSVEDTPLSAAEESVGDTVKTLFVTDYFYKTYRQGRMDVRFYAAYWAPGRTDPRQVWAHQPDNCWAANGGRIVERDDRCRVAGGPSMQSVPALFRVFEFPQGREEVLFWHLVAGKPSNFDVGQGSSFTASWRRLRNSFILSHFGLLPKEQMVVRISTNRTINELVQSGLWTRLVESLSSCGLFETISPKLLAPVVH